MSRGYFLFVIGFNQISTEHLICQVEKYALLSELRDNYAKMPDANE